MKRIFSLCLLLLLAGAAETTHAQLSSPVPLTGHVWSSNIGWISFSGPGYGVEIETDGDLVGYAWSSNIGWIKFGGLSSFPGGDGDASLDFATDTFSGWARACAGTAAGDCSSMADHADGWDGWISLNCLNNGSCGTSSYAMTATNGTIGGFIWGSDVIGWIEMSNLSYTMPCAPALQCLPDISGYEQVDQWCQVVNTTTCSTDYVCDTGNPGTCIINTLDGSISARPATAREGNTVEVTWSSVDALSCTVEQQNAGGTAQQSWTGLSGTQTSDVLQSVTIFSLLCTNAAGLPEYEVASTTVRLSPINIET